ncbi:MAG: hypothetical protein QG552_2094, partial [Thermodesulfobacteriota bacterium]|nr:hypothetical protein [Thermodesulfobacteriota bacterium]
EVKGKKAEGMEGSGQKDEERDKKVNIEFLNSIHRLRRFHRN